MNKQKKKIKMNRPTPNEKVRNDNFCIDTLVYMEEMNEYCIILEWQNQCLEEENERLVDKLEKRDSPMKVKYKQGKSYCPINKHRVYKGQKHCAYCGQKLDWKN